MARPFNPEADDFVPYKSSSPTHGSSDASDESMSTFSDTILSYLSSLHDESPNSQRIPRVSLPTSSTALDDSHTEPQREQDHTYIPPTWEEEVSLYVCSGIPRVRLHQITSAFHPASIAPRARRSIVISSDRPFPNEIKSVNPQERFVGVPRVQFPAGKSKPQGENTQVDIAEIQEDSPEATADAAVTRTEKCAPSGFPTSRFNPEAAEFITRQQSESKKFVKPRYPTSKLNPEAREYLPKKRYPNTTFNAAAPEFLPRSRSKMKPDAQTFIPGGFQCTTLDPRAAEFTPIQEVQSTVTVRESSTSTPVFAQVAQSGISEQRLDATEQPSDLRASSVGEAVPASSISDTPKDSQDTEGPAPNPNGEDSTSYSQPAVPDARADSPDPHSNADSLSPRDTQEWSIPPDTTPEGIEHRRQARLTEVHWDDECDSTGVHHFSFFGVPVARKCATKPATSLAIITGAPKIKMGYSINSGSLHRPIMLYNASLLVDPVVYRGDPAVLDQLRGSKLENTVTGFVNKAYSDYGWWRDDGWDRDDDYPDRDPIDQDQYGPQEMYFNTTHRLYYAELGQLVERTNDPTGEVLRKKIRRQNFVPANSRLSLMTAAAEDEPDEVQEEAVGESASESFWYDEVSDGESLASDAASLPSSDGESSFDEAPMSVSEVESGSEAETTESIVPGLAVSPLRVTKSSDQAGKTADPSEMISPLKPRKSSAQSAADDAADGIRGDVSKSDGSDEPIDERMSYSSPEDSKPSGSEETASHTSSSKPSSTPTSSSESDSDDEKANESFSSANSSDLETVEKCSAAKAVPTFSKDNTSIQLPCGVSPSLALDNQTPIALPLRPRARASSYETTQSLIAFQDLPAPLIKHIIPIVPAIAPKSPSGTRGIVRSPECRDLHSISRADDKNLKIPYHPWNLTPITEGDSLNEFYRGKKVNVGEISDLSVNKAESASHHNAAAIARPHRRSLTRRTTSHNLRIVSLDQDGATSSLNTVREAEGNPTQRGDSPIKRPNAPTPGRMRARPKFLESDSSSKDEHVPESTTEGNGGRPSTMVRKEIIVTPPQYSEVFGEVSPVRLPNGKERVFDPWGNEPTVNVPLPIGRMYRGNQLAIIPLPSSSPHIEHDSTDDHSPPPSPSPLPKGTGKYTERFPSSQWFGQKDFVAKQESPASKPDIGPNTPTHSLLPSAAPPILPSIIDLALPYKPPANITRVTVHTPLSVLPPSRLGWNTESHFAPSSPDSPSPSKSLIERIFPGFPGFQATAAELSEFPGLLHGTASIPSNEAENHDPPRTIDPTRSVRDVLFQRLPRSDGTPRPSLRSSSWVVGNNKLQKKKKRCSGGENENIGKGQMQVRKGRFGKWIGRIMGSGKRKDMGTKLTYEGVWS